MKTTYLLLLSIILCLPMYAQKNQKHSEDEFRNKKKAYIIEKAELTSEEAEAFFPIYFELQNKKKAINKDTWKKAKTGLNITTTEKEYEEIIDSYVNAQQEIQNLEKEYIRKYQKILSNKKIFQVYHAEIKFNRNMLKIMQKMDEKDKTNK